MSGNGAISQHTLFSVGLLDLSQEPRLDRGYCVEAAGLAILAVVDKLVILLNEKSFSSQFDAFQRVVVDLYSLALSEKPFLDLRVTTAGDLEYDIAADHPDVEVILSPPLNCTLQETEEETEKVLTINEKRRTRHLPSVVIKALPSPNHSRKFSEEAGPSTPVPFPCFEHVCLGGTFDRLHSGHKALVTTAAFICSSVLHIGISDSPLLTRKKHKEVLESLAVRAARLVSFVRAIKPSLTIKMIALQEPLGPTATERDLPCLVVSEETSSGAEYINKKREENGIPPMHVVIIPEVSSGNSKDGPKLSSSSLRHAEWLALGHTCEENCR
mmetsp:Transcript_23263/g.40029  ORF Transcript_23263/g.40029 Transcript_23263/m.40029 type:complete len:328 (+) Transcript_23263:80-1063(+)|eukprot:CAMPEP_0196652086 /NCGR_PEP_ID=MMETSP1086-20130531/1320_1 /TAXON_ID=77921 /ORGANISM="Cyanoptyche  gloeocystis , Strain SAG4.97" /LENGTH=327 /DNA_ID=CAMNT_0041982459 /DNA_START=69 /DNA_END=1052 /DNA_ORIENTATION=-